MTNKKRTVSWLAGLLSAAAMLGGPIAHAKEKLTLQLPWVVQTQFAGYYVAKAKGFYDKAGLDVTIKAGGPDTSVGQVIAAGGADVVVNWLPTALASREKGLPLVNIGQIFKDSGQMLTCRADAGVKEPQDLRGKTLGVWFSGKEFPFLTWMSNLNIPTDGSAQGVKVVKLGYNVDPLLQKQAACISTTSYNEYWQVIDGGLKAEDLVNFRYSDHDVSLLEDGFYVLEDRLKDEAFEDTLARFVAASFEGWRYAIAHPDEAVEIVLDEDQSGSKTPQQQKRMLLETAKLLNLEANGKLDEADYNRTVNILLSGKSDPVIAKQPEGAWTHRITDKANAK